MSCDDPRALIIDFIVVGVYFAVILSIGLSRGKEKSLRGYALADRSIPWWAVVASILAAEISAATFLGAPSEGFSNRSFTYAQLAIGTVIARLLVAVFFIRKFYDLGVISIYEYLEHRFGRITRCVGSMVFLLTRSLASGTRLYVAAIFLVVGIEVYLGRAPTPNEELTIYLLVQLGLVILTAIYTTIGGIKAVVWTDFIQATILILSLVVMIGMLLFHIPGGWEGAHQELNQPGDLAFITLGVDSQLSLWDNITSILSNEYTIFAALLGSVFITLATHGTDQDMVQRMLTAKNTRQSQWSVILSGLIDLPVVAAFLFVGILMSVYYAQNPDPHLPTQGNHVLPYFVLTTLPAGFRGLIGAALMATAMGSLSTALNSLATSYVRDFHSTFIAPNATEEGKLRTVRWATIAFAIGLVSIGMVTSYVALKNPHARIIPIVLGSFGYTYGSLLGVFLVGLLTKTRGSDLGNIIGMIAGFIVVAVLSNLHRDVLIVLNFLPPDPLDAPVKPFISFPWRVLFGAVTTFAVAVLFRSSKSAIARGNAQPA